MNDYLEEQDPGPAPGGTALTADTDVRRPDPGPSSRAADDDDDGFSRIERVRPQSAIDQGDYSWHRMSTGTEIRRIGSDEDSDDDASQEGGGNDRAMAVTGDDLKAVMALRAQMGLPMVQRPTVPAVPPRGTHDDVDTDSDAGSDPGSVQTEDRMPGREPITMNAGVGGPGGPAVGSLGFGSYFSTFGARMKQAGFLGALRGRGGRRAALAKAAAQAKAARKQAKAAAKEGRLNAFAALKHQDREYVNGRTRRDWDNLRVVDRDPEEPGYSAEETSRWNATGGLDESQNPFLKFQHARQIAAEQREPRLLTVKEARAYLRAQRPS